MYIDDVNFEVSFSSYSESHFCKSFYKKYKSKAWIETRKTIIATLERSHSFYNTSHIDIIIFSQEDRIGIFKLDFRIAGSQTSPRSSGNRVIFALNNITKKIDILLVYHKNDCPKKQTETQWIRGQIKDNFPEHESIMS